ncbi:MAG TPA: DUF4124 domain-containing protein [Gammaproteobacteria bacterium]|nr:DUF4124 domain-containing protein [Gammaproteobacteria bacterium]
MKTRILALILATTLTTVFAGAALAQDKSPKLYKWVDKNGIVHYGSSVPPEYANQQLEVLNSEGLTVKTIQAPKAKEAPQDAAAAAAKAKQEQAQQATDQMLLDTYTSVNDIEQDRDTHLKALNAQIDITNAAISGLRDNLAAYQKHEQQLERQHRPIPAELKNNLLSTQQQLEADQKLLVQQQQQKPALQAQYDAYIKRFQQLTANPNNGG